jgi:hypothetical protein
MKKNHTCPRYTAGLAAVYRNSRAVSRPVRAGAGGSDRGATNRSYRAVYRALAAVNRPVRAGAGGSDRGAANRSYCAVYRALAAVYRRRQRGR